MSMDSRFERALRIVLEYEGVTISDNPNDLGGVTNSGIAQSSHPGINVTKLSSQQIRMIYYQQYYKPFENLPGPMAFFCFQFGVNVGPGLAAKILQECLGVTADGIIGPITEKAAKEQFSPEFMAKLGDTVVRHYFDFVMEDQSQREFLQGWMRRTVNASMRAWEF